MSQIHEVATITSKGQITLPKPIRQALGVATGGKVAFDFDGTAIVVTRAEEAEHTDPAIARFLALIEQDITAGKNVAGLPDPLAKSLKKALRTQVDLAEEIQGDVSL
jgi:antitoxin PrlF